MENSSQGLVMLDPEHKVVVTGEEHHQPALAGYAPRADGRSRRVAVELRFTPARRIEVLLDGRRVGELTKLMSQRYGRHVDAILARGGRPGAVGLVVDGRRGVEMELRLPDAGAEIPDATTPMPLPPAPRPAPPGPDAGRPPHGPRSRFRTPLLVGGGVFALLVVVGSVFGGADDERDARTSTVAAAVPAVRPAPTSTPAATLDPQPDVDLDRSPVAAPQPAATRAVEPRTAESRVQPDPEPQRLVGPPQPEPEPEPAPEPAPEPEPRPVESGASVSYANCDAVRAADAAPILAGEPGYSRKLDRDGDGIGCE